MKKSLIVIACVALLAVAGPARAAEVTVDFDIDFPSFLILSCYDNFSLTISGDNLATILGASGADIGDSVTASPDTVSFDGSTGISAGFTNAPTTSEIDPTDLTQVPLALTNLCAVRAIGGANDDVGISVGALNDWGNTDGGTIGLESATPNPPQFTPGGLGSPQAIDVNLELDISSASQAGTYTAGNFTVTATLL